MDTTRPAPLMSLSTEVEISPVALRGAYMSVSDLEAVGEMVGDLVTRGLIPHIERRLRYLHEQVIFPI